MLYTPRGPELYKPNVRGLIRYPSIDSAPPEPFVFPTENLQVEFNPAINAVGVGNAITSWRDVDGNISPLIGTCTRVVGGVNTFDYMRFNGIDNILGPGGNDLSSVPTQTVYGVFRVNSFNPSDFEFIMDGPSDWNGAITVGLRTYGPPINDTLVSSGPVFGGNDNYACPIPIGTWYVYTIRMRGDVTTDIAVNLGDLFIGDGGGSSTRGFTFGAHASGTNFGECDIARLAVYSGIHEAPRTDIINGLMQQFDIQ